MLGKIFQRLEDPKNPFLGPTIKLCRLWGLLLPETAFMKIYYIAIQCLNILFHVFTVINLWFLRKDPSEFINSFKYSIFDSILIAKGIAILFTQNLWKSINEYIRVADIDQRTSRNRKNVELINKFTKYSRNLTYILVIFIAFVCISQPSISPIKYLVNPTFREQVWNGTNRPVIIPTWFPFERESLTGYLIFYVSESIYFAYACMWVSIFDCHLIAILVFFKGELELLRLDCADIFRDEPDAFNEAKLRIAKCHSRHVLLKKHAANLNSFLLPIMFMYILGCSLIICITVYQITITGGSQLFVMLQYLLFVVLQIFLYCWHCNELFYASDALMLGPYESSWWSSDVALRRSTLLLAVQFQQPIVFSAGPFSDLNINTFINIMKGAYSYYTLLSQSQV